MNAIVFSGGGSKGAYQVGVYEALHEAGLRPDVAVGTSVGAILATLVAEGASPATIRDRWFDVTDPELFPYRKDVWRIRRWSHLRDNTDLGEALEERVDWEAVRSSDVALRFTAVDVCTGRRVLYDNVSASPEALLGSTSIPVLFDHAEADGRLLWDGGIITATPLKPAIEAGAREVYSILSNPMDRPAKAAPGTLGSAVARVLEIAQEQALRRDLARAQEVNELVADGLGREEWREIHLHTVAPRERLDVDLLGIEDAESRRLMDQGYEDGRAFVDGLHDDQEALLEIAGEPERVEGG